MTDYIRPELTPEEYKLAEALAEKMIRKFGLSSILKMLAIMLIENVRLTKEVNEHRAARGIAPLETFEV